MIIFGYHDVHQTFTCKAINAILVAVKYSIYKCKIKKCKPSFTLIVNELKAHYEIEKFIFYQKLMGDSFDQKWRILEKMFRPMLDSE